ncbi:MAG: TonB-dependent receptor [Bacteroidota bacterium]
MNQLLRKIVFTIAVLFAAIVAFGQGVTTSSMNGKVTDSNGEALPGATVIAVHAPSGTQYGNVTDLEGFYRIPNMRVGGPYEITVSFIGYQTYSGSGIFLSLGETFNVSVQLASTTTELNEVVITAGGVYDNNQNGQKSVVDLETINNLPTISRAIGDFARFNPLANISEDDGDGFEISLGGQNNRYNTLYIDGAVNNDVFGLSGSGTNGGQTGVQPISIDAIEQFQVAVAPFDVRQSGFAGGSINAVTRSGTNEFEGSAYYFVRNEDFAGKTPTNDDSETRRELSPFTAKTYGFRLGGPIIKDKLFFFANYERQDDETPQPFDFNDYDGDSDLAGIAAIRNKLISDFNYDPGIFDNNTRTLESDKVLAKIDWNINQKHKLSVRHSYVKAENLEARRSDSETINFINGSEFFETTTNSTALELNSTVSENSFNKLKIGVTIVRDDRDPSGSDFPTVRIFDGSDGTINLGAERFSTANLLDQDIITINNDFEWFKGKHSFLVGANFEYYNVGNLFIRNNFGRYTYFNPANFLADGTVADEFERSFSQVDNVTGDESEAIADFEQILVGAYFQDEIRMSDRLTITAGIRFDIPIWLTDQPENAQFNNSTIPLIEAEGYDLEGAKTGEFIKPQLLLSPRVGFNYDLSDNDKTQLRGGFGIFTSRIPLVWPGGAYNNYGFNIGETQIDDQPFIANVNNQPPTVDLANPAPSGQVDLFSEDFKVPQVFKINLAVDRKLPWGMVGTIEGLYTKNLNNVRYQNLNLRPSTQRLTGTPDDRPVYEGLNPAFGGNPIDPTYSGIYLASNTSKGYAYNIAASLTKPFDNGFDATLSYSFGDSFSLFDGTSSQNNSQWRGFFNVDGRNDEGDVQRSTFSVGHRIFAQVSYTKEYLNFGKSKISLIYNGQSGDPYSFVLGARNFEIVDDGGFDFNELAYIPASRDEINLVDIVDDGVVIATADQQWDILNAFIEDNDYLSDNRGSYAERNGDRLPFESVLDLRFLQDFYIEMSNGKRNTLQLSLDIFNFSNLLNKDWGRIYQFGFGTYSLVNFEGFENDGTTPTYSVPSEIRNGEEIWDDDIDDNGFRSSRWQMQLGLRYIFGN